MQPVYRWGQHTEEHFTEKQMTPALQKLRKFIVDHIGTPHGERVGPDSWCETEAVPIDLMEAVMAEIPTYCIHLYGYRASELKRAPKVAFRLNSSEPLNHVIIIRYSGPEHHAPPHHDKQEGVAGQGAKDILKDTPIVSVTACANGDERTFTVAADDGSWDWRKKLGNRDLFVLGPETNKSATHEVPKEGRKGQVRYSMIFRTVKLIDLEELSRKSERKKKELSVSTPPKRIKREDHPPVGKVTPLKWSEKPKTQPKLDLLESRVRRAKHTRGYNYDISDVPMTLEEVIECLQEAKGVKDGSTCLSV